MSYFERRSSSTESSACAYFLSMQNPRRRTRSFRSRDVVVIVNEFYFITTFLLVLGCSSTKAPFSGGTRRSSG